jgi:hypothetical protein
VIQQNQIVHHSKSAPYLHAGILIGLIPAGSKLRTNLAATQKIVALFGQFVLTVNRRFAALHKTKIQART